MAQRVLASILSLPMARHALRQRWVRVGRLLIYLYCYLAELNSQPQKTRDHLNLYSYCSAIDKYNGLGAGAGADADANADANADRSKARARYIEERDWVTRTFQ